MIKSAEKSLVAALSSIMENWRVGSKETLSSTVVKDSSVVDLGFKACWVFLGFRHWNTQKVMNTGYNEEKACDDCNECLESVIHREQK